MLHGLRREGEHLWVHRWHMWPVSPPSTSSSVAAASPSSLNSITPDSFSKDGRKIHVGDCALFKPPQDSPPFVGIIRRLIVGKDENLSLGVNWLYRPADVNLGKDILLEAAPNEVFYSFHQDETPAASLLHPCKVSFLRKGVELPSGISSFVCRRVYDTEKPRLWWLTDRDYINSCLTQEKQEEVDQLLDKTRLEMYGALQSGGRSPKPLNGPNGTAQLKPGSDSVQNSSSSFPSQAKGKKREQGAHGPESVKRERLSRADDADSGQFRLEHVLKSEIAKITDKGGLVDFEGVEKLVQLMQPDSAEKKIDLACRIMLVDVISVTERFDCLGRFVQLRGLPVLDEWLQEVHKGKIGDGSPKESEKSVDEFLFALLRALDRLPVNLHALQTCNVGKSVNHLRTHKNSEIQKKARTLVDTWKKRVEAEMNIIDAKSGSSRGGSWPTKSVISEVSQVGSRRVGASSEVGAKSSNLQPSASKPQQAKLSSGEAVKFSLASPGSTKVPALSNTAGVACTKDSVNVAGAGSSDVPLSTIKEEKSSSSSQSQNNSQSCSSDHGKAGASGREDARSSTAGSVSLNKVSSGVSRSRKSGNGSHASAIAGVQKEVSIGKFSSLNRNLAAEKGSPTRAAPERVADLPPVDNGSSQRLIVRLPNTGRSPARSASGGSPDDASASIGKASPMAHSEKHDHHDRKVRGKVDAPRGNGAANLNMDSCQGKDGLVGTDGVHVPSIGALCDERGRDADIGERLTDASKATTSASGITMKPWKSYEASFSSINALVESCAKFSEASASASVGDDIGMNLLASVAAGEMSRSDASPIGSPERKLPLPEDSCSGNDAKLRQTDEDGAPSEDRPNVINGDAMVEQGSVADSLRSKAGSDHQATPVATNFSGDSKVTSLGVEEKTGECSAQVDSSVVDLLQNGCVVPMASDMKPPGFIQDASAAVSSLDATSGNKGIGEGAEQVHERRKSIAIRTRSYNVPSFKLKARCLPSEEDKNVACGDARRMDNSAVVPDVTSPSAKVESQGNDESASWSSSEMHDNDKKMPHKQSGSTLMVQKPSHTVREKSEDAKLPTVSSDVDLDQNTTKAEEMQAPTHIEQSVKQNTDSCSSVLEHNDKNANGNPEKIEVSTHHPSGTAHIFPASLVHEVRQSVKSSGAAEMDLTEDPASRLKSSSVSTSGSETVVRLDFDLNEVLPVDDSSQGELDKSMIPGNLSCVHMPCPLPVPVSSMSGSLPASVTVAAAAKGPFLPSESLLRSKVELGWKGSAATSAFRPAEPRKAAEVSVTSADVLVPENLTSKQARPLLDFDLNVGAVEDAVPQNIVPLTRSERVRSDRSGGGLNLDLNTCDDSPEIGQLSVSNGSRFGIPQLPPRTLLPAVLSNSEPSTSRDFDLNNGPGPDEVGCESILPLAKNGLPFMSPVSSVRMNNTELGNFSSWFSPGNTYSTIPVPPILPGRGDQSYPIVPAATSQRLLAPATASTSFGPEMYRGPVLSSSPAVAFPSTSPFQYSGFPFDTNFALPSNSYSGVSTGYVESSSGGSICFPPIPTQLVGPSGVVSTSYRPYVMSLPGGASNVVSDSRKWGSQGLDLNAGPVGTDLDRREERMPSALRQLPLAGSQALAEEQLKMFQQMAVGGVLKRKEPDGGWDGDRLSYKHPAWQ